MPLKTIPNEKISQKPTDRLPTEVLNHHLKSVLERPLREWTQSGRFPPVLLLTGQRGIGKKRLSSFLAHYILCEDVTRKSDQLRPCMTCLSCQRVIGNQETSLIEIQSEADLQQQEAGKSSRAFGGGVSGSLKIEQFRRLKNSAGLSVEENRWKIILIPEADRMTIQSANSMLKILEETPLNWIFLLTAADQTLLLPTLISRCQVLRLKPLREDVLSQALSHEPGSNERKSFATLMAQGSYERALELLRSEEVWKRRNDVLQFLVDPSHVILSLIDFAAEKPEHFEILLDLLEQFCFDLLRWSIEGQITDVGNYRWPKPDTAQSLGGHINQLLKKHYTIETMRTFWFAQAERIARARSEALVPLNKKLLIGNLLIPWIAPLS